MSDSVANGSGGGEQLVRRAHPSSLSLDHIFPPLPTMASRPAFKTAAPPGSPSWASSEAEDDPSSSSSSSFSARLVMFKGVQLPLHARVARHIASHLASSPESEADILDKVKFEYDPNDPASGSSYGRVEYVQLERKKVKKSVQTEWSSWVTKVATPSTPQQSSFAQTLIFISWSLVPDVRRHDEGVVRSRPRVDMSHGESPVRLACGDDRVDLRLTSSPFPCAGTRASG